MHKLACCCLSLLLVACAVPEGERVTVDGLSREYILHIPAGLSGVAPLLIVLHGGGGTGGRMRRLTGFDELADEETFFALYPSAMHGNWNDGRVGADLRANAEDVDDVEFLDEVLDGVIVDLPVDQSRIYVTGASNGGIFALTLACSRLGPRLAAIAPVIGAFAEGVMDGCEPRPLSVQLINGSADELVPVEGGDVSPGERGQVASLAETTDFWVEKNGCTESPTQELRDDVAGDETSLVVDTWAGCARGSEVKRVVIEGGGHTWPGADGDGEALEGFLGVKSEEIDASEAVWEFVSRFQRR